MADNVGTRTIQGVGSVLPYTLAHMSQAKNWCFTLHHPQADFDGIWTLYCQNAATVVYSAWQLELTPTTDSEHIQGMVCFSSRQRLSKVLLIAPLHGAHFEVMRGSPAQSKAYCHKEESRYPGYEPSEYGILPGGPGARTDLLAVKRDLDDGKSEAEIADTHFGTWCRYRQSFSNYKRLKTEPRDYKTEVEVVVGPTGTGKTLYASSPVADEAPYFKQNSPWWDGYDGQHTVVLDDFYGWIKFDEMLRLMDRYPLLVQGKGTQHQFLSRKIIITSNSLPHTWYSKIFSESKSCFPAFQRRVTKWIFMGTDLSIATSDYEEFSERVSRFAGTLE